jgi:hypothetical protein
MDLSSRSQSPAQHLQALYPLARVLAGGDEADALIRRVYKDAAAVPPADRPDDTQAWLFQLMLDAQDTALESASAGPPDTASSFTDDSFRQEVAEALATDKLPVAFAACSVHERFLLSIDALTQSSDEVLAQALDLSLTEARSVRDQARSGLRASLRDVLNGPERMLIDVALPDDALRRHLRTLLGDRFRPVPPTLQSDVSAILSRSQEDEDDGSGLPDWLPAWVEPAVQTLSSPRGISVLVLVLVLGLASIGTVSYLSLRPSSSDPTSLVTLSVQRAASVRVAHPARSPEGAAAYVQQAWGRQLSPPTIEEASLQGIGRTTINAEDVPVLVYADAESGRQITAYAFNYALLDRLDDRVSMAPSLRTKLAAGRGLLPFSGADRAVVLWRQQDDIFVVVGPGSNPDALRARIQR